jgi:hypothetical protein
VTWPLTSRCLNPRQTLSSDFAARVSLHFNFVVDKVKCPPLFVGDTARARARRTTKKKRDDEEGQAVRDDANDDELFGDGEWVGDDGEW